MSAGGKTKFAENATVNGIEVKCRRPCVGGGLWLCRHAESGACVERHVVVEELPHEGGPAVWVGLFRLLALRAGSTISATGPAARLSLASKMPPGLAMSMSAALTTSVAGANEGREGKIRPKFSGWVAAWAPSGVSNDCPPMAARPLVAPMAAAPAPATFGTAGG